MATQQSQINESSQLAELLPQIKALSAAEKLQLLHLLATDLLYEAGLTPLGEHPVTLLRQSSTAASVLASALAEHQTTQHG
ncbi:MAG: hypothetical protein ACKO7W_11320 [Elainella sp.]